MLINKITAYYGKVQPKLLAEVLNYIATSYKFACNCTTRLITVCCIAVGLYSRIEALLQVLGITKSMMKKHLQEDTLQIRCKGDGINVIF
jgi:hypothetical protein